MKCLRFCVVLLLAAPVQAELRSLFDSIREVETGSTASTIGDGGRSLGPYQIQRSYWKDAGVPGSYQQVRNRRYAERVMLAYWQKYCPKSLARGDYQTLARVHNGGAAGARKRTTVSYWRKVNQELRERRAAPKRAR